MDCTRIHAETARNAGSLHRHSTVLVQRMRQQQAVGFNLTQSIYSHSLIYKPPSIHRQYLNLFPPQCVTHCESGAQYDNIIFLIHVVLQWISRLQPNSRCKKNLQNGVDATRYLCRTSLLVEKNDLFGNNYRSNNLIRITIDHRLWCDRREQPKMALTAARAPAVRRHSRNNIVHLPKRR